MSEQKSFSELLTEAISLRGLSLDKLSESTGISKSHLAAFIKSDFKNLPSAPYARGCLMKISGILGIDGDYLWSVYKKEAEIFKTKNSDNLPVNRFAIKRIGKKKVVFGIVLIFAIIYLSARFNNLVGIPEIKIIQPASDRLIVNEQSFTLRGELDNFFDKLLIDNKEISIEKDGKFEKKYELRPGINKIEFKVKRFLGKEIKVEKEIIYQL